MSIFGEIGYALISTGIRAIDFLVPDVAVEEAHRDELVVTEFPVEIGAGITDHAYKRPPSFVMRVGFSDSTGGVEGYSTAIYQQFLSLQAERRPFTVFTGKRAYTDVLITSLDTVTDVASEHALFLTVGLREIIRVSTGGSAGMTNATNLSLPSRTLSVINRGALQAVPLDAAAAATVLSRIGGGIPVPIGTGLDGLSNPPQLPAPIFGSDDLGFQPAFG